MNGYDTYMERLLELKNREIELYKNFIENELKCKIQTEVMREEKFNPNTGLVTMETYKYITIPERRYILKVE